MYNVMYLTLYNDADISAHDCHIASTNENSKIPERCRLGPAAIDSLWPRAYDGDPGNATPPLAPAARHTSSRGCRSRSRLTRHDSKTRDLTYKALCIPISSVPLRP